MKKQSILLTILLILCFSLIMLFPCFAEAKQLTINNVQVDYGSNSLYIYGENFNAGSPPNVYLGRHTLSPVVSYTATMIQATLPEGIVDGEYLLTVSIGTGTENNASYDLIIGSFALQGEQGVPGATGPAGPAGVPGATGPAGPAGALGPTGPAGADGVTGPTGPAGPAGQSSPCNEGDIINCYSGEKETAIVGPCKMGHRWCDSQGVFGTCEGEVLPSIEDCENEIDDDCDGALDTADSDCACGYDPAGVCTMSTQCPGDCSPGSGVCIIDCENYYCMNITLPCPPGAECRVNCGSGLCAGATINCPDERRCEVNCNGSESCKNVTINCSTNGSCLLNCDASSGVCDGAKLVCGTDTCTSICSGISVPTVECGASCECVECL